MQTSSIADQVLALAGMIQAAALASKIASDGQCDTSALAGTLHSVLALDADDCESVFIGRQHLQVGLSILSKLFEPEGINSNGHILRYCNNILRVQQALVARRDLMETIYNRLQNTQMLANVAGSETHPDVIANIAALYVDTVSTLRLRIQINGKPDVLQKIAIVAQVRAVLLGGIRAAILWRQKGGSRIDFFFKRKAIYSTALALLKT